MAREIDTQLSQLLGVSEFKYRGDFIGFQYGEETSASLRILRVSDGSRYYEDLLPNFEDKTVSVPRSDRTLYFGSNYSSKEIEMQVAFDELEEEEFLHLYEVFDTKILKRLILDERPYKYYLAKPSSIPKFKYVCFDQNMGGKKRRIYKGEGTINFRVYNSFSYSVYNYLEDYINASKDFSNNKGYYYNFQQWADSTHMRMHKQDYDILQNGQIKVWNAGVKETPWILKIPFDIVREEEGLITKEINECFITLNNKTLHINKITIQGELDTLEDELWINSNTYTLEGYRCGAPTNNLFNNYFEGNFSNILPRVEQTFNISGNISNDTIITYKHIYY